MISPEFELIQDALVTVFAPFVGWLLAGILALTIGAAVIQLCFDVFYS